MFAFLLTPAALTVSAVAQLTLTNSPTTHPPVQCEVYEIAWTGGTTPFDIRLLIDADVRSVVEEIASSATTSPVQWTANVAADNQAYLFSIQDSAGATVNTGTFDILPSSNSACLSVPTTGPLSTSLPAPETSSATSAVASSADTSSVSSSVGASLSLTTSGLMSLVTSSASSLPSATSSSAPPAANTASPSPLKTISTAEIVGIAVGAACVVLLVVVGIAWAKRRSRRAASAVVVLDAPDEAPTSVAMSVEPFSSSEPWMQEVGPSKTASSTPVALDLKDRGRYGRASTTAEYTSGSTVDGVLHYGTPQISSETAPAPVSGDLNETILDRLVNQVVRRLQAQEAPPAYPESSHPSDV